MICKKFHFGICREIGDLKTDISKILNDVSNATEWRSRVRVLVIDDSPFPYETYLKAKGFNIAYEKDIRPEMALNYDLILCDQCDVGKQMGAQAEGGGLARAIKERFPLKFVVLYTSQTKIGGFDKGLGLLDDVVYSGMDDEDFESKMNKWCEKCLDPVAQWKRLRALLLDKGISVHVVAELESDFVAQYLKTGTYVKPQNVCCCGKRELNDILCSLLGQFAKVVAGKALGTLIS